MSVTDKMSSFKCYSRCSKIWLTDYLDAWKYCTHDARVKIASIFQRDPDAHDAMLGLPSYIVNNTLHVLNCKVCMLWCLYMSDVYPANTLITKAKVIITTWPLSPTPSCLEYVSISLALIRVLELCVADQYGVHIGAGILVQLVVVWYHDNSDFHVTQHTQFICFLQQTSLAFTECNLQVGRVCVLVHLKHVYMWYVITPNLSVSFILYSWYLYFLSPHCLSQLL